MQGRNDISDPMLSQPNLQTAQDVEDYIGILTEHQLNCEKAGKYPNQIILMLGTWKLMHQETG